MAAIVSTAYYTKNISDPLPPEWDSIPDNSLVMRPYGLFVKLNIKNIETLCPDFASCISGANMKLFAYLPKTINGGFLLGGVENSGLNKDPTEALNWQPPFSGWYSGQEGVESIPDFNNRLSLTIVDNYASAWFSYGLSSYNHIDVTSKKTYFTYNSVNWPGTFPWGGADPIGTGIILNGWDHFKDYAYMDYEVCSKMPDCNYIGYNSLYIVGTGLQPQPGCLPFFTKKFAPLFFRTSFRGANGEKLDGGVYKTFGFADNHMLNIYIDRDTGELHLYFYTNQSMGRAYIPTYSADYIEETQPITTPANVLSFLISPKTLSYNTCHRPRNMGFPDSIVWNQSESLDLNNVLYNVPKIFRIPPNGSSTSSTPRFSPISAPKEMQTYLPMLGLKNSQGDVIPDPTPRTTEKGYTFAGTWNTTASTWV